jgi:hypothetical protein
VNLLARIIITLHLWRDSGLAYTLRRAWRRAGEFE